jgi:hypothetical protein
MFMMIFGIIILLLQALVVVTAGFAIGLHNAYMFFLAQIPFCLCD